MTFVCLASVCLQGCENLFLFTRLHLCRKDTEAFEWVNSQICLEGALCLWKKDGVGSMKSWLGVPSKGQTLPW